MDLELSVKKFKELIPDYVIKIAEKLQENGLQAFLVGGSIRDILLGEVPNDFDIATSAYPEDIMRLFEKSIPTGAKFGTIVVVSENTKGERFDVEVTTYRSEADYYGGRWPTKVEFTKTIEEDLARRDFTINAIALDLQHFDDANLTINKILVDPYNGIEDLKNKVIKAVRSPLERMSEDGLRGVRACRLAAQLEFTIEPETFKAIEQTIHVTKRISIERFRDEFLKILSKAPKPSVGIELLRQTGILELFIPELLEGLEVTQPQFHVDDVYTHSLKTCDLAEDSIKLAALFHDIGKPRCKSVDEKGVHFYGHEVEGERMTIEILRRLRLPNYEIERTANLVRAHMFYYPSADYRIENPNYSQEIEAMTKDSEENFSSWQNFIKRQLDKITHPKKTKKQKKEFGWSDGAIRRLIKNVGGEDAIDDLLKLRIADATANPKTDFNPKEIDALAQRIAEVRAKEMALKVTDLDVKGEDLIEAFNLYAGPEVGSILNHLLEKVIEDPLLNKKETLIKLAKEFRQQRIENRE
jgi:tRNA nucleotidyltransferase (CCA-adding enzyme)